MLKSLSLFLFLIFVSACQPPLQSALPVSSTDTPQMHVEIQGQTVSEEQFEDFLIQKLNLTPFGRGNQNNHQNDNKNNVRTPHYLPLPSKPSTPWYKEIRHGDWRRSPELLIQDVLLSESDESVSGTEAPAAIHPDFAGQEIQLTLKGHFEDRWRPLPLRDFLFTLDPELLQETFVGLQPRARVLLDNSILLQVDSVSADEIQATLNTERVPDLYLKGLHRISVEYGQYYSDGLIQIGDPEPVEDLQPRIDSVEVLRDRRGTPLHLRLSGDNFMVFPKFSYALIDGEFGFGYQTEVLRNGGMETVVHIPDPEHFDDLETHSVIYATPFGVDFQEF